MYISQDLISSFDNYAKIIAKFDSFTKKEVSKVFGNLVKFLDGSQSRGWIPELRGKSAFLIFDQYKISLQDFALRHFVIVYAHPFV